MEKEPNTDKGKPSGIGGKIESVIERITESRAKKIEENKDKTKLGFVDRLLVKINKFKEGRYDKSIAKLEGKIGSINESIGEKKKRIEEIENFVKERGTSSDYMTQEKENAESEEKKLRDKMQELVTKKGLKEGRRGEFIEGRDKIINPVVGRLEKSMAEAKDNFEELKKKKKAWGIANKLAKNNYKEGTKKLDDMTSRLNEIMRKSRFRDFLNEDMKAIKDRREKLKNDMDEKEEKFIEFNRKMEEMDEKAENYKNQIDALKGMKGEGKEEVKDGEKSQGKEEVKGGENKETQEKPRSIAEKWEKMSFKDYVEAWKDFLLKKKFDEKSVEDFKEIITTAEVEEADREINFDDFKKKIEFVNEGLELINKSDWNKTTEDFKNYIIEDKKNKSQNYES